MRLQIKAKLSRLVRKEDGHMLEGIKPDSYPTLIRLVWYTIFDPSRELKERQDHHSVIRDIFEIYGSNPLASVIGATTPVDKSEQVLKEREKMLSLIGESHQLIVPIMFDGILPGAFAYDHLRRKGMPPDVVFIGCTRNPVGHDYYVPREVHAARWDIELLRSHSKSSILVVDDAIDNGSTIKAVARFMDNLGIRKFDFACLRNVGPQLQSTKVRIRL